ncbi:MAG: S8 family serine peptidase [Bacteroidota bacterium]
MRVILVCLLLSCLTQFGMAQERMWVFFTDKGPEVNCQLTQPENLLGPEAIAKRKQLSIPLTESDVPVYADYVAQTAEIAQPISRSRWLNAVVVEGDAKDFQQILDLPFVRDIRPVATLVKAAYNEAELPQADETFMEEDPIVSPFQYGRARHQNDMVQIMPLHAKGVTGKGVKIAVFDAGFRGADTIDVFDSLHTAGRLLAAYDFVDDDKDVYHASAHGTQVLSTIAANLPGKMVGTAPHVSVILCRTEDARSETRQEEHNWVKAMEWVDSIGVDIIHSSLGYSTFDTQDESYTYEQMDGNTTIITKAADVAAAKGILVTVSAGNEGNGTWHYITAPCDGDSVLCIGSVNRYQKRSSFSSFGPAADGRIKPDVVAMGSRTTVASPSNRISSSDGTSFSGPIVAGLVACLRQAHPDRSNMDIIKAIQLSGDQTSMPDEEYGYGIPRAYMADSLLSNVEDLSTVSIEIAEKPKRGRKAKPASGGMPVIRSEPQFTENPQTVLDQSPKLLKVTTAASGAKIKDVKVMRGRKRVSLGAKGMKLNKKQTLAKIKLKDLAADQYYIVVKTDQYEEKIPFEVK